MAETDRKDLWEDRCWGFYRIREFLARADLRNFKQVWASFLFCVLSERRVTASATFSGLKENHHLPSASPLSRPRPRRLRHRRQITIRLIEILLAVARWQVSLSVGKRLLTSSCAGKISCFFFIRITESRNISMPDCGGIKQSKSTRPCNCPQKIRAYCPSNLQLEYFSIELTIVLGNSIKRGPSNIPPSSAS